MKVLLVGGKNDGNRVEIQEPVPSWYSAPVKSNAPLSPKRGEYLIDNTTYLQTEEYEAMRICGSAKGTVREFTIYGLRGLNHIDLVAMLIAGYRS